MTPCFIRTCSCQLDDHHVHCCLLESAERRSDLRDLKTSVISAASKILRRDRSARSESVDIDLDSDSYQERNIDVEIAARGGVRRSLSGQKLEQHRPSVTSQAVTRRQDVYTAKLAYMRGMETKACSVDSAFQQAGLSVTTPVLGVSAQRVDENRALDDDRQSSFASQASSERHSSVHVSTTALFPY